MYQLDGHNESRILTSPSKLGEVLTGEFGLALPVTHEFNVAMEPLPALRESYQRRAGSRFDCRSFA
jgi:hypothetical protein